MIKQPIRQQIIDMYLKRKISYRELGRIYKLGSDTISHIIKAEGIKTAYFKELDSKRVTKLYEDHSLTEIAKIMGVSISPIIRILKGKIRTISEANMGQKAWNKGIPHSEEQKALLSKLASLRTGEKNSNWRGGISPKGDRRRTWRVLKIWRSQVIERDGKKCMWCGSSKRIEVNHIIPLRDIDLEDITLLVDMNNGIVLCRECQQKIHYHEHEYKDIFHNLLKKSGELREHPKGQS